MCCWKKRRKEDGGGAKISAGAKETNDQDYNVT